MVRSLGKFVVLLVLLGLFLKFAPAIPISSVVTQKQDQFTVSGEGKVTVVPDMAVIDVGITANRPTVKAAQGQANSVINGVSEAVKKLGVDTKDIKSTNYSIYPQYDYSAGSAGRITGYQVSVNLNLKVRNIDLANQVVDAATGSGANTVGGIQLTVNDDREKELLQEARELAVKEAKAKAASLAKAAGISLGRIINIQEAGSTPGPIPMLERAAMSLGGGGDTKIEAGSTDITSSVTLTYETR